MGRKTNINTSRDKKLGAEGGIIWAPVLAAIITAIATIIVAVLGSPLLIKMWEIKLTPSPVVSTSAPPASAITETVTHPSSDTLVPFATNTFAPSASPSLTDTPTPIIILPTETPPTSRILVSLSADSVSGKSPLTVKFDARSSYLLTPDGERHPCQTGACHYTWKAYLRGQQAGRSDTDSGGTFHHTFRDKGSYIVTVQVCWGKDRLYCSEASTFIEVTP